MSSLNGLDPEALRDALTELRLQNEAHLKERFNRSLPFADGLFDRWERARRLGFGERTSIYDSAIIYGDVTVCNDCWIGPGVILDGSGAALRIGSFCSISAGVHIYTHDTVHWALSGGKLPPRTRPVSVGDNVYIGGQCLIVAGVSIGSRCLVAAGSLVTKSIPDGTVVGGVPARPIGRVEGKGDSVSVVYSDRSAPVAHVPPSGIGSTRHED